MPYTRQNCNSLDDTHMQPRTVVTEEPNILMRCSHKRVRYILPKRIAHNGPLTVFARQSRITTGVRFSLPVILKMGDFNQ